MTTIARLYCRVRGHRWKHVNRLCAECRRCDAVRLG
jgi:hypothetical protein